MHVHVRMLYKDHNIYIQRMNVVKELSLFQILWQKDL
jgi:hypothetical protein